MYRRLTLLLSILLLAGCGGGGGEGSVVPVEGIIQFQGRPLEGGTIVFTPDTQRGGSGPLSWAPIGPDGRFQLRTDGKAGAVVGWHRITIAGGENSLLPSRYRDPGLSGVRFEVRADRPNECSFRLD